MIDRENLGAVGANVSVPVSVEGVVRDFEQKYPDCRFEKIGGHGYHIGGYHYQEYKVVHASVGKAMEVAAELDAEAMFQYQFGNEAA